MAHARETASLASVTQPTFNNEQSPNTDNSSKKQRKYSESVEKRIKLAKRFIKDNILKDKSQLIKTTAYGDANKAITKGSLGVIGGPKTGKSTLIATVIDSFTRANDDYVLVSVSEPEHLDEIPKGKKCLLIMDNMFAMYKYKSETGERWLRKFETINSLITSLKLKIVFTMNALVYNTCKATFRSKPIFMSIIHLYDDKYTMNENFKRQVLEAKMNKMYDKKMPLDEYVKKFIDDASKQSSNFGFLFWCQSLDKSVTNFKPSLHSVESCMKEMLSEYGKESEVLYLVLFMGGQLDVTLQESDTKRRFEKLSTVFSGFRHIDPKEFCEIFEGVFLKSDKRCPNKFSFVEREVECVTLKNALGKYGKQALEWCCLNLIMDLVSLGGLPTESLSKENLKIFAGRIRHEINEVHRTVDVVLEYKCLRYGPFLSHILPEFTAEQANVIAKRLITKICVDGDINSLKCAMQFLRENDDPVYDKGRSPYKTTIYSENNDDDAVNCKLEVLILNKLNYMNTDSQASNVFHLLAEKRGLKCLEFLLKFENLKWLIDQDTDMYYRTPLHTACIEQNYEAVEFFLQNCDDQNEFVNKFDRNNRTALHFAVEYIDNKQPGIIEMLLKSGAKTDIMDDEGKIPLHEIRHCSDSDCVSQVVKLLLDGNKSQINTRDTSGLTPLHLATKAGNVEAVRILLLKGADVTIEDYEDVMTALMFACQECVANSSSILKLLLDAGSDFNLVNRFGLTALHEAVAEGNVACVETLLKYRADPNMLSQNEQKETAIHIISSRPDLEAFQMFTLLYDHGADIYIRDSENKTALDRVSPELLAQIENFLQKNSVSFV